MVDAQGAAHLLWHRQAADFFVGALGGTEEIEGVVQGDALPVAMGGVPATVSARVARQPPWTMPWTLRLLGV